VSSVLSCAEVIVPAVTDLSRIGVAIDDVSALIAA
jgi:hypothetical protein